jgi:hypothetical protein
MACSYQLLKTGNSMPAFFGGLRFMRRQWQADLRHAATRKIVIELSLKERLLTLRAKTYSPVRPIKAQRRDAGVHNEVYND